MTEDRIRCAALREKCVGAEEAARLIQDGMTVAVSGFTAAGCPKEVPLALARQVSSGGAAGTGQPVDRGLHRPGDRPGVG